MTTPEVLPVPISAVLNPQAETTGEQCAHGVEAAGAVFFRERRCHDAAPREHVAVTHDHEAPSQAPDP